MPGEETPPLTPRLRLPTEIWALTFEKLSEEIPDHIQWFSIYDRDPESRPWQLLAIQNLRLVCRTFCNLASPLLCPYLYLEISYESIDRAKGLLKNPRIACGLRGIRLSLAYRPGLLASSRSQFSLHWEVKLENACLELGMELEEDNKPFSWEDNPGLYEKLQAVEKREDMIRTLGNFGQYLGPVNSTSCYNFFRSSHELYKEKHWEQFELLMSGSFVRQLAAALGRVRQPLALHFTDDIQKRYSMMNHRLFLGDTGLADAFIQPPPWNDDKTPGLLPARVLTELPIAIAQAGGWLQSLKLSCPIYRCCHIFPPGVSPERSMAELRSAFRFIRVAEVSCPGHWCAYTSALLSSRGLRHVRIGPGQSRYANSSCPQPNCKRERRRGRWLRTAEPTVRSLRIEDVTIFQAELVPMLSMLSPRCKDIWISSLKSPYCNWSEIIEVLRRKAGSRIASGKCKLHFTALNGGEFPQRPRPPRGNDNDEDYERELAEYDGKMKQVLDYIAGKDAEKWWSG